MGFYDEEKTANQYIDMAEGYDGKELIDRLTQHLPSGSTLLELGMGPGADLNLLKKHYQATGSDNSPFFLERYHASHPDADLLCLDAVELVTERKFDCIFSNKVLHHLTDEELVKSFERQSAILSNPGLIMHSFWRGTGIDEHHGLKFVYQTEDTLRNLIEEQFRIVELDVYTEMETDDSMLVLASR